MSEQLVAVPEVVASDVRRTVIDVMRPDIRLLPPFTARARDAESRMTGLRAEGDAGSLVLELPVTCARMKERYL